MIRVAVLEGRAFHWEPLFAGRVEYSTLAVVDSSFVRSFFACFMRVLVVLEEARAPTDMFGKSKGKLDAGCPIPRNPGQIASFR